MTQSIPCGSKLNLGLRITGRRTNGYHELESLFLPLVFGDELRVESASALHFECHWGPSAPRKEPLPPLEENIVLKALRRLGSPPLKVELTKEVPLGSGLGGGSADVGALLKHLKQTSLSQAVEFGADVPFFLRPELSWVTGVGEKLSPVKLDARTTGILLVFPPQGLSTPQVFETYRELNSPFSPSQPIPTALESYLATCANDLEPAAIRIYPLIGKIIEELKQTGPLYAGMTGSGSTCFAVFPNKGLLQKAAKDLEGVLRKYNCRSVSTETPQ